jgi:peptidyl-tRNA hydrolase, PTH1 family
MKLIIALGNPGKKYQQTRHNLGEKILRQYLNEKHQSSPTLKKKLSSHIYETGQGNQKKIFAIPDQYMNKSGFSVKQLINFYKIDLNDLYIIHDDIDLEVGEYRLQFDRGSAGHNGVKSIVQELNSQEFNRIRIGVNKSPDNIETENYVLQPFSKTESDIINKILPKIFAEIDKI